MSLSATHLLSSLSLATLCTTWPYLFALICPSMPITFAILTYTRHARDVCEQIGFPQPSLSPAPPPPAAYAQALAKIQPDTADSDKRVGERESPEQPLPSLLFLLANKEAVLGCVLLAVQAAGEWRATGIALGAVCLGGVADVVVAVRKGGKFGWAEAVGRIGMVKMLGCLAAWRIWRYT
jgi:hypothetical protein